MATPYLCNDSGYGSLAARSTAAGKFEGAEGQQSSETHRPCSGIVEAMETMSVFSDANSILGNPDIDRYISAFADQLAASAPPGFDATTTGVLDHLLEAFAVRLSYESTERPQRHLTYIAYRFRRSVKRPYASFNIMNT